MNYTGSLRGWTDAPPDCPHLCFHVMVWIYIFRVGNSGLHWLLSCMFYFTNTPDSVTKLPVNVLQKWSNPLFIQIRCVEQRKRWNITVQDNSPWGLNLPTHVLQIHSIVIGHKARKRKIKMNSQLSPDGSWLLRFVAKHCLLELTHHQYFDDRLCWLHKLKENF